MYFGSSSSSVGKETPSGLWGDLRRAMGPP